MTHLQVLAAGSNAHGQLANSSLDDAHTLKACVFVFSDGSLQHQLHGCKVVSIASGANHTLLLLERHSPGNKPQIELWGCGDGRNGQLGPGHLIGSAGQHQPSAFRRIDQDILDAADVEREAYVITSIAASWESSYVVLHSQQGMYRGRRDIIISMGKNDFHDLGVDISTVKTKVGHGPYCVALEAAFKAYVITGFHVMSIAAGTHHVVAAVRLIFDHGEEDVLVGWGACRHGQLSTDLAEPAVNIRATTSPRIISLAPGSSDLTIDTVSSFALGNYHTVMLHRSGCVTGLGSNKKGQLTGLRTEIGAKSVHCTWNSTYLVLGSDSPLHEWEIRATGSRDKGQLGGTPLSTEAVMPQVVQFPFDHTTHRLVGVACGSEHVLALFVVSSETGTPEDRDTEVWGWGWNEHGNLGLGHVVDANVPTKIWSRSVQATQRTHVLGVWAGCGTSWIVEAHRDDTVVQ